MKNIFYRDNKEYNNQLDPVNSYIEQLTFYIATKKSISQEEAKEKAVSILKEHFRDRPIKHFTRQDNGDRIVEDSSLLRYITTNIKDKNILVPTFTSYKNASKSKSILSEFIFVNVKKRSLAKKASHKAKAEGNSDLAIAKNNEQNTMKIYNNSLSGVFGQEACALYNPTAHNTLTSITRTMTSLSNASNEKLISGNRCIPRPIDVLNSIVYITSNTNLEEIRKAVDSYNLYIPTVQDTIDVLRYSSDLYFVDKKYYSDYIEPFLNKLDPYYLAAICYIGDLYHIRKFNDNLVRTILDELLTKIVDGSTLEDISVLHKVDEALLYFVHNIFYSDIKGYGKDYEKMNKAGIASSIYKTSLNVINTLNKYKQFFNTFFMNEVFPTNSHRLNNFKRRTVVLSDTDSTCFTLDEWVIWYMKSHIVNDKSIALAGCLSYIASQNIVNSLAILSKVMNVSDDLIGTLAMKNEYLWRSFFPLEVSKHYFADTVIQEGNVYSEPDLLVKGVHIKNSAIQQLIISKGKEIVTYIFNTIAEGKKVKFNFVLSEIIGMENRIIESVTKGETLFLKKSKIKGKEAYAQDEFKSPYQRHTFWMDVFSEKYGIVQNPPYDVVKIPTIVNSPVSYKAWLESIEDIEIRTKLFNWMETYKKKDLPTIYLAEDYILGNGIPKEIIPIIDIRRIVMDINIQHRMILEGLGVMLDKRLMVKEQLALPAEYCETSKVSNIS